jgi:hypothetical protein
VQSVNAAAALFVEHLSARDDVNLRTAVAFLLRQERRAVREACAADVERRGRRREDCPPDCRCADAAHLAAALRALPLE